MLLTNMAKNGAHKVVKDAEETLELRIGLKGLQSSIYLDKSLRGLFTAGIDNVFKRYMNEVRTFMEIAILRAETENNRNQWQFMLKELIANYQTQLAEIEQYAEEQEQLKVQINQSSKHEQREREFQLTDLHKHLSTALIDLQSVYQIFTKEWHDIPKAIVSNSKEYQQLQAEDQKIVDNFMASKIPSDPKKLQKILSNTDITPKQALTRAHSHLEMATLASLALIDSLSKSKSKSKIQHPDPKARKAQAENIRTEIEKKEQAIKDQESQAVKLQALADIAAQSDPHHPQTIAKMDEAQSAVKKTKEMEQALTEYKNAKRDVLTADKARRGSMIIVTPSAIKDTKKKHIRLNEIIINHEKEQAEKLNAKVSTVADNLEKMIQAQSAQASLKMAGG